MPEKQLQVRKANWDTAWSFDWRQGSHLLVHPISPGAIAGGKDIQPLFFCASMRRNENNWVQPEAWWDEQRSAQSKPRNLAAWEQLSSVRWRLGTNGTMSVSYRKILNLKHSPFFCQGSHWDNCGEKGRGAITGNGSHLLLFPQDS